MAELDNGGTDAAPVQKLVARLLEDDVRKGGGAGTEVEDAGHRRAPDGGVKAEYAAAQHGRQPRRCNFFMHAVV